MEIIKIIEDSKIEEHSLEELREKVLKLRELTFNKQGTKEWLQDRESMITASDMASVLKVTPEDILNGEKEIFDISKNRLGFSCNPYSSKNAFLKKKCSANSVFWSNEAVRWGSKYEEIIQMIYSYKNNTDIHEFGLIQHPEYHCIGASPDGITDSGRMLEIKCPVSRKITGIPPFYYWIQVQIQLEVCDLELCDFVECSISETMELCKEDNVISGKLIELYNINFRKEPKYIYPCIGNEQEIDTWIKNWSKEQDPYESLFGSYHARTLYWKVNVYSHVTIKRDREWFKRSLPHIQKTWDEVLEGRISGEHETVKKTKVSIIEDKHKYARNICMIQSDSED